MSFLAEPYKATQIPTLTAKSGIIRGIKVKVELVEEPSDEEILNQLRLGNRVNRTPIHLVVSSSDDEALWNLFQEHKKELEALIAQNAHSYGLSIVKIKWEKGSIHILLWLAAVLGSPLVLPGLQGAMALVAIVTGLMTIGNMVLNFVDPDWKDKCRKKVRTFTKQLIEKIEDFFGGDNFGYDNG